MLPLALCEYIYSTYEAIVLLFANYAILQMLQIMSDYALSYPNYSQTFFLFKK